MKGNVYAIFLTNKNKLEKESERESSFAEMYEQQLLEFNNIELSQEESDEYIIATKKLINNN
jgi:hypothetical protein